MEGSDWTAIISKSEELRRRCRDHLDGRRRAECHLDQAVARRRCHHPLRQSRPSTKAPPRAWAQMLTGIFISASYVTSIDSAANKSFLAAMQKKFGAELRTPNDLSVPEYEGIYLYKAAVEKAGSTDTAAVLAALAEVSFVGPRGTISMSKQHHAPLTMYLGQVKADGSVRSSTPSRTSIPANSARTCSAPAIARRAVLRRACVACVISNARLLRDCLGGECPPPSMIGAAMMLLLDMVTTAAILFIVAAGLLAIFGVLKIINFAHGAWLTIGAYCALATAGLGLNPWLALPIAFAVGAVLGGIAELCHRAAALSPAARRHPRDLGPRHRHRPVDHAWFGRDVQFTPNLLSGTVDRLWRRLFALSAVCRRRRAGASGSPSPSFSKVRGSACRRRR